MCEKCKPKRNRLSLVLQTERYTIYKYQPSPKKLFYKNLEPLTLKKWIRFQLELRKGYFVYYLSVSGQLVGSCVVSKGGGRYSFADKKDIVVGPLFVLEKYRGNKYSELLIGELLHCDSIKFDYAYEWIRKDNIPSLRCCSNAGFEIVGSADLSKVFRRICVRNNMEGKYYILKYSKN